MSWKAPDFKLEGSDGRTHSLSNYKGRKIVLYFYPKDNTPGCTVEACGFRDKYEEIKERGAVILGISPDSVESHKKFIEKQKLSFVLLSDTEKQVAEKYTCLKEKSMFGKKYKGIERSTFIIDENGNVVKEFRKVNVKGHIEEVLEHL